MASLLDSVTRTGTPKPPRVLIYGTSKVGKTTWATESKAPIVIQIEDGLDAVNVAAFPRATSYEMVVEQMGALCAETHEYKTLVVDSLDWLEKLIWERVAADAKVKSIEDIGYGKGYFSATDYWRQFIAGMNWLRDNKNMVTILIAHAEIKRFDAPDKTLSYDRYQPKLHKSASALICEAVDVIGFANYETTVISTDVGFNTKKSKATGNGARWLHLEERPAFIAGSRYKMPDKLPLNWASFAEAFATAASNNQKQE